ncbi:hypothetical protein N9K86_03165 [Litoricolaceae bacterium]|nr:hypothetical protein [Litorivicinaceae bacterium]MDB2619051.1 hypothetical protein [Litorivicinaceae bacterium]
MTDIPEQQSAPRPVGLAVLIGLISGAISHELFWIFAPAYQWVSVFGLVPGFYLLRIWINLKLKSMHVIESDDMTVSRKLAGKVSYSESFSRLCGLVYSVCFLLISISGNLIAMRFPEESVSIFNWIDLIDRVII